MLIPSSVINIQGTTSALTSSASATITASAQTWIVPSVAITPSDYRTANVTWPKLPQYSNYSLQWATNSSFTNVASATVSGNSHTINNLNGSTTYYFRVQAVDGPSGWWSPVKTMKTTAVTMLKSTLLDLRRWPSGSDIDSKGNLWVTGYVDHVARIISPDGTVKNVGTYDDAIPAGMTLVNDNLALLPRSYREVERASEAGIYSISNTGVYTKVSDMRSVYGMTYDSKRDRVYVTTGTSIQDCDYKTWKCTIIVSQTGSSFGYVAMTPSNDKIVIAGRANHTLSLYDLNTKKHSIIDSTPSMDIRGIAAISETEFAAGSASTLDVWKIKTNADGTAMASKQLVATDIAYPLNMSWDPNRKIFYMGGTAEDGIGIYRFENMFG